jgi:hypothetical protein
MWLRKRVLKWLSKDVHAVPTATRAIGDIKIVVERGQGSSRSVQVSAWEPGAAQKIFWSIWDGISEREAG